MVIYSQEVATVEKNTHHVEFIPETSAQVDARFDANHRKQFDDVADLVRKERERCGLPVDVVQTGGMEDYINGAELKILRWTDDNYPTIHATRELLEVTEYLRNAWRSSVRKEESE